MTSTSDRAPDGAQPGRWLSWLGWILFAESLILLLALAGPGSRPTRPNRGDHALIARWFLDDPSYLDAVLVNVIVLHVFIVAVFVAARITTRARRRSKSRTGGHPDRER